MNIEARIILMCSMRYGQKMGFFWVFKYVFFILGVSWPFFSYVYWGLTFLVPLILAYYLLHNRMFSMSTTFLKDWSLSILIFFFSALIVSLAHYIFYQFLAPPNYIADSFQSAVDVVMNSGASDLLKETMAALPTPTPIQMTLQGILNNVFYGVIVSLPVAAITSRIKFRTL